MKKQEKREIGFLAQNLRENFPFSVSETLKDTDIFYANYAMMNLYLIEALQELQNQNAEMDKKLNLSKLRFQKLSKKFNKN